MPLTIIDGVILTSEAALSASVGSYGVWDDGAWDTATFGPDEVWTDISPWVRSLSTGRRFGRELQAWESGTATTVLLNGDGRFSPSNMASPYVVAGVTGIRPWRPIRHTATWAGVTYPLYRGYVRDWVESWPDDSIPVVSVPAVDEWSRLAGVDRIAQVGAGSGETFGARVHRILDSAGHIGERAIDSGSATMLATTLTGVASDELSLVADSEGGAVYVGADGTVLGERRYSLIESARSTTVRATFGDGQGPELPCSDMRVSYSGDLVRNIVSYQRVGGAVQTVADPTSRALYMDRRDSRTNLVCETDDQVLTLAEWALAAHKAPELRFEQIEVKPGRDPDRLYPVVLGLRIRDLIRCVRYHPSGETITRDCHIAGISHRITRDDWVTTFDLWSASPYTQFASSKWDTGVFGDSDEDTSGALWFF